MVETVNFAAQVRETERKWDLALKLTKTYIEETLKRKVCRVWRHYDEIHVSIGSFNDYRAFSIVDGWRSNDCELTAHAELLGALADRFAKEIGGITKIVVYDETKFFGGSLQKELGGN